MKKKIVIIVLSVIVLFIAARLGLGLYFHYYLIDRFASKISYNEQTEQYIEDRDDGTFLFVWVPEKWWKLTSNLQVGKEYVYDLDEGEKIEEGYNSTVIIKPFVKDYTLGISLDYTNEEGEIDRAQIELDSHGNLIEDEMSALDISVYESKKDKVEEILDIYRETWGLFLEE